MPSDDLFARRFREAIGDRPADFARKAGLDESGQRNISNWLAKPESVKPHNLALIAKAANRPIAWFFGEEPPMTVIIPVLDVKASAGPGCVADVVRAESEFPFPLKFLIKLMGQAAYSAKLESLRASGRSMTPTIADGALLIIDRAQTKLPEPRKNPRKSDRRLAQADVYVFYQSDDLRLKRLRQIDARWLAILSDNEVEHPVEMLEIGGGVALNIVGKVIWWDNRL